METMRVRDVEEEVGLGEDLRPRLSKPPSIHNHHHHHYHLNSSSDQSVDGFSVNEEGRDSTDNKFDYNVKDAESEFDVRQLDIQTDEAEIKVKESEAEEEGEVVDSEENRLSEGSFDFSRNNVMGIFDEQIRVSGSQHTNGHSENEHQITSYSSQETTISDCTSEETDFTKTTSIPKSDDVPTIPSILKGKSSVKINIRESEEDVEVTQEYDVEKVLEKQEAYDLFCPNCQSCITKRVILRRRKRKVEEISVDVADPESEPEQIPVSAPDPAPAPPQHPEVGDREEQREPIFYRCLSCFSIFIPSGWFRRREDSTVIQEVPRDPQSRQPLDVPPSVRPDVPQSVRPDVPQVSQSPTPTTAVPSSVNELIKPGFSAPAVPVLNFPVPAIPALKNPSDKENDALIANEAISKPQPDIIETMALPIVNRPIFTGKVEGGEEAKVPGSKAIGSTGNEVEAIDKKKGLMSINPSDGPSLPSGPLKVVPAVVIDTRETNEGKEVTISIPESSQSVGSVMQPYQSSTLTEPLLPVQTSSDLTTAVAGPSVATSRVSGVDIMKSIVYGGLVESIASLSVVSSAAGANTATLNILALGIANLIGGLFALGHNLRVLKHESSSEKYEEALGEPGHFSFHATVVVISYILFGSIPPLVYGFAFRESDVLDYKMIAVAVASLVSVMLLSAGKAYVRSGEKGYLKTVSYYVIMAVMASGVSFVVGDFLDWLMEKLGWFSSSSTAFY